MQRVYNGVQSFSDACNRGVDFVHAAHEDINCSDAIEGRVINGVCLAYRAGSIFGAAGVIASLFVGDILYRITMYTKAFFAGLLGGEQSTHNFNLNVFAKYAVIVLTSLVVIEVTSIAATVFPAVTPLATSAVLGSVVSVVANLCFDVFEGFTPLHRYNAFYDFVF